MAKKRTTPEMFAEQVKDAMEKIAQRRMIEILHLTKHGGKLEGLESLSTCSYMNPYCLKRMEDEDSVCYHCYVRNYMFRRCLIAHLVINFKRLTTEIISVDQLPSFYTALGRIESFGDAYNETQVENYWNTMVKNAGTTFAVWSKNLEIYYRVFKRLGLPDNMSFVASSNELNVPYDVPERYKFFVMVVFTVYDFEYVRKHNIPIDCGFSKCIKCRKCYDARKEWNKTGKIKYVNEILKQDAAKYQAWVKAGKPA